MKTSTNKEKYGGKSDNLIIPYAAKTENEDSIVQLSIIGRIACGKPEEEVECRLGVVDVPLSLLGAGDYFILETFGNSMVNAGIDSGDLVLVKRTCEADPNDIVVAMNGNHETTLKTLKFDKKNMCYYLHPEAYGYEDIYPEEIDIIGIATKVIKDI